MLFLASFEISTWSDVSLYKDTSGLPDNKPAFRENYKNLTFSNYTNQESCEEDYHYNILKSN